MTVYIASERTSYCNKNLIISVFDTTTHLDVMTSTNLEPQRLLYRAALIVSSAVTGSSGKWITIGLKKAKHCFEYYCFYFITNHIYVVFYAHSSLDLYEVKLNHFLNIFPTLLNVFLGIVYRPANLQLQNLVVSFGIEHWVI